jgi:WD40 repeat protein
MNESATTDETDLIVHALPDQPYPGLRPFTREEWTIFFGRESMVQDVVERVVSKQMVAVHGDSGCGKSSLIAAGVMPFLERDQVRAGGRWGTAIMRPEGNPLSNLAKAIAGSKTGGGRSEVLDVLRLLNRGNRAPAAIAEYLGCNEENNVCILFDQFEELFEHARLRGVPEAELITDFLVGLADDKPKGLHAILTMRSDYLGQCAHYRGFAEAVNDTQYLVPRMERPALMRAIREPAALFGGSVDLDLAVRLIADAGTGQDQLPLIQHGLMLMWQKTARPSEPPTLALDDYRAGGDLAEQLSTHADETLAEAVRDPAEEPLVEELFRALTDRNREGQAIRRQQTFAELVAITGAPPKVLTRIINCFRAPDASFLRPFGSDALSDDIDIDISHEAFIRNWRRISRPGSGWLDREGDDGLIWTSLRIATLAFERDPEARLSNAAAIERERWLRTRNPQWSKRHGGGWEGVSNFIATSVKAARAAALRRRVIFFGAIVAAVVCATLAVLAGMQTMEAHRLAEVADVQKAEAESRAHEARTNETISLAALSRVARSEGLPIAAIKLAVAAWPRAGDERRPALRRTIDSLAAVFPNFRQRTLLAGHEGPVNQSAYSPDGTHIVTASDDGTARVWDAATGATLLVLKGHTGGVISAAFSPDGKRIVTASSDRTARVWDAAIGTQLLILEGHGGWINSATFSPDGKRILTASSDKTARISDAATGAQLRTLFGHESPILSATFSPDGTRIVTASDDKTARVWDAATGKQLLTLGGHESWVRTARFSPDGARIVTASGDKTARVWNASTGAELLALRGHDWAVRSAAFSTDGTRIVTASDDWTARVWSAKTGTQQLILIGSKGTVWSSEFSPDGTHVVTSSDDKSARVWDVATGNRLSVLKGHREGVYSATFSPDSSRIVTASADSTARIWDVATARVLFVLRHDNPVASATFSSDGKRIATGSDDWTARLWETATGAQLQMLEGHDGPVLSIAFSPDGKRIVTGSADNTARVWDAATGAQLLVLQGHDGPVSSVAYSPGGTLIVTASVDKTARVWNAATGQMQWTLKGHEREGLQRSRPTGPAS